MGAAARADLNLAVGDLDGGRLVSTIDDRDRINLDQIVGDRVAIPTTTSAGL
jgi:hypothetical protein